MSSNIGSKLKKLAEVILYIGIIGFTVLAVIYFIQADDWSNSDEITFAILGLEYLVFGNIINVIISYLIYAVGEIVDNTTATASNSEKIVKELQNLKSNEQ